jgi:Zn-dependent peptidase ImmA (M78 family)
MVLHSARLDVDDATAERDADRFAGAFLVPADAAKATFSPRTDLRHYAEAKAHWGVSIQALVFRAWTVGAIDSDRRTSSLNKSRHVVGGCRSR